MATICRDFNQEDPFKKRHIFLHEPQTGHSNPESRKEDADRMKIEEAKKAVKESKELVPENVQRILDKINDAEPYQANVIYSNVLIAIGHLENIENIKNILGDEAYNEALKQFEKDYADFKISAAEIHALRKFREQGEAKLVQKEAYSTRDMDKLKAYALAFISDSHGERPDVTSTELKDGETYTIDFRNPGTDEINQFAQQKLILGHIMQATGLEKVRVEKPGKKTVDAYLWPDGKTYENPTGSSSHGKYVEILQGYKITVPKKETAPEPVKTEDEVLADVLDLPPLPPGHDERPYTPGFEWDPFADPEDIQREMSAIGAVKPGTCSYRQAGTRYVPSKVPGTLDPKLEAVADLPIQTVGPRTTADYRTLFEGTSVELPSYFRKKDSFQQIAKMKDMQYGKEVYDAVSTLADIKSTLGETTDTTSMWDQMRGRIILRGGRYEISFDEICRAVYEKSAKKLFKEHEELSRTAPDSDELKLMNRFLEVTEELMNKLPNTKEIKGVGLEEYRKVRESAEFKGERANMASVSSQIFERNNYGPPARLNVIQALRYTLNKEDRPIINEDTWTNKPTRKYQRERKRSEYGEIEIMSEARSFDKLMEATSTEEYVASLNKYMLIGKTAINALAISDPKMIREVNPSPIRKEDVLSDGFSPDNDQIAAIRHGMMIEGMKEMKRYQEALEAKGIEEDPYKNAANPAIADIFDQIRKDPNNNLSEEQLKKLEEEAAKQTDAFFTALVEDQDITDIEKITDIDIDEIKLGAGISKELGESVSLDFMVVSGLLTPVLTTSGGLSYRSKRFGKHEKFRASAYARTAASLTSEGIELGAGTGAELKYDFREGGAWSVVAGVHGNASLDEFDLTVAANLGVERDLKRVIELKVEKFKEEHPEFNDMMNDLYLAVDTQVASGVMTKEEGIAIKMAADRYMDNMIANGTAEKYTKGPLRKIRFTGAGVMAAAGLEGGFGAGVYCQFAIGTHTETFFVKSPTPFKTTSEVAADMLMPEPNWVQVDIPEEILWVPEAGEDYSTVRAQALESTQKTINNLNEKLGDQIELSMGSRFTNFELLRMQGTIQLYVDPTSDIEVIQDGAQNIGLNLMREDKPIFRIREVTNYDGSKQIDVLVTEDPKANIDDVIAKAPNYLTWQQYEGKKTESQIVEMRTGKSNILTALDAETKLNNNEMQLGTLSADGADSLIHEIKRADLKTKNAIRDAKLFDENTERLRDTGKKVGIRLAKEWNYDELATSNQDEKIDNRIRELYVEEGTHRSTDQITDPEIFMARQYAMEAERPKLKEVPLKWNEAALKELAKGHEQLAIQFFRTNKEGLKDMKGEYPEGTQFYVYINEKGMKKLYSYYDKEVNGNILAPIKWDAENPEKTLQVLGASVSPETQNDVIEISNIIKGLDWEQSPFASLEAANFEGAINTMPGNLLLNCADDIYGAENAEILRTMALHRSGDINPELAKQFAEDVHTLFTKQIAKINGRAVSLEKEVRTGLYSACYNLTVAQNFAIRYEEPKNGTIAAGASRVEAQGGLESGRAISYVEVKVPVGVGALTPEVKKPEEASKGEQEFLDETITAPGVDLRNTPTIVSQEESEGNF